MQRDEPQQTSAPDGDEEWTQVVDASRQRPPQTRREPSGATARAGEQERERPLGTRRGPLPGLRPADTTTTSAARPGPSRRAKVTLATAGGLLVVLLAGLALTGGEDAAEPQQNAARPTGPGASNGRPSVPVGARGRLDAFWTAGEQASPRIFVRWVEGGATALRGQLRTADGTPIVGAQVDVLARRNGETQQRAVGSVRTGRDGVWTVNVPVDDGAEQRLTVQWLSHANATVPAARAEAALRVGADLRADVSSRLRRPGQSQRVRGRILSDLPRRGQVPVMIETLAPGQRRWQEASTTRTSSRERGRFEAAVLVPTIGESAAGRWRVRARVADNPRLGWLGSTSAPSVYRVAAARSSDD